MGLDAEGAGGVFGGMKRLGIELGAANSDSNASLWH